MKNTIRVFRQYRWRRINVYVLVNLREITLRAIGISFLFCLFIFLYQAFGSDCDVI